MKGVRIFASFFVRFRSGQEFCGRWIAYDFHFRIYSFRFKKLWSSDFMSLAGLLNLDYQLLLANISGIEEKDSFPLLLSTDPKFPIEVFRIIIFCFPIFPAHLNFQIFIFYYWFCFNRCQCLFLLLFFLFFFWFFTIFDFLISFFVILCSVEKWVFVLQYCAS